MYFSFASSLARVQVARGPLSHAAPTGFRIERGVDDGGWSGDGVALPGSGIGAGQASFIAMSLAMFNFAVRILGRQPRQNLRYAIAPSLACQAVSMI